MNIVERIQRIQEIEDLLRPLETKLSQLQEEEYVSNQFDNIYRKDLSTLSKKSKNKYLPTPKEREEAEKVRNQQIEKLFKDINSLKLEKLRVEEAENNDNRNLKNVEIRGTKTDEKVIKRKGHKV